MKKRNPHIGSNFDDFLKQENIFEEVQAKALKHALAEQIQGNMSTTKISTVKMARLISTCRS
jgi:antitoxin HicB